VFDLGAKRINNYAVCLCLTVGFVCPLRVCDYVCVYAEARTDDQRNTARRVIYISTIHLKSCSDTCVCTCTHLYARAHVCSTDMCVRSSPPGQDRDSHMPAPLAQNESHSLESAIQIARQGDLNAAYKAFELVSIVNRLLCMPKYFTRRVRCCRAHVCALACIRCG
jgi:hypothetical protein